MGSRELSKKFPIELLCLSLLEERDMYGYEIMLEFRKRSHGRIDINIPTIYMALKRLNERGYVTTYNSSIEEDGPRERSRLYYRLEPSYLPYKEKLMSEYYNMVLGVQDFFDYGKEGNAGNE